MSKMQKKCLCSDFKTCEMHRAERERAERDVDFRSVLRERVEVRGAKQWKFVPNDDD